MDDALSKRDGQVLLVGLVAYWVNDTIYTWFASFLAVRK